MVEAVAATFTDRLAKYRACSISQIPIVHHFKPVGKTQGQAALLQAASNDLTVSDPDLELIKP